MNTSIYNITFIVSLVIYAHAMKQSRRGEFQCITSLNKKNQPVMIKRDLFCDGIFHCKDLSDEYLCPVNSQVPESVAHKFRTNVILHSIVTDLNITYTKQMLDMTLSKNPLTAIDFMNYDCSRKHTETNEDCKYCGEDELLCPGMDMGDAIRSFPLIGSGYKRCIKLHEVCDKVIDCQFGEDEYFCKPPHRGSNHSADHMQTIPAISDTPCISCFESFLNTSHVPIDHKHITRKFNDKITCDEITSTLGSVFRRKHHRSFMVQHLAPTNETISLVSVCDGVFDCANKADELFCPGRFYCRSGDTLFVEKRNQMNGHEDCDDGSDEWPLEKSDATMASKDSMIKDELFFILIWIIGLLAFFGNFTVIASSSLELISMRHRKFDMRLKSIINSITNTASTDARSTRHYTGTHSKRKRLRLCNLILVLNLAIADFLMSVYLLALALVKVTHWGGTWENNAYWRLDNTWRTSSTCSALGVVVMTASLTSLYTLFGLTTLRMHTVLKPFSNWLLNPTYIISYCLIIWFIAIGLSLLPLIPYYMSNYVHEVLVTLPHFKPPVVNQTMAQELVRSVLRVSQSNATLPSDASWLEMESILRDVAPRLSGWKYFGFYSAHSVCVPKLFVGVGESAWEYTVFFLSTNFIVVLYITTAYMVIYFKTKSRMVKAKSHGVSCDSQRDNSSLGDVEKFQGCFKKFKMQFSKITKTKSKCEKKDTKLSQMQARIAVLVITDCVCWLPICIMCFARLAGVALPASAYQISAIILLPINSALNPILYSRFTKSVFSKFLQICKRP